MQKENTLHVFSGLSDLGLHMLFIVASVTTLFQKKCFSWYSSYKNGGFIN